MAIQQGGWICSRRIVGKQEAIRAANGWAVVSIGDKSPSHQQPIAPCNRGREGVKPMLKLLPFTCRSLAIHCITPYFMPSAAF